MKQTRFVAIAVIIIVFIIGFLICRKPKKTLESTNKIQIDVPVSVTTVQKQRLTRDISLVGSINANNDVNVIAETQGVAKAVYIKVGDFVRAGTVLVQVDDEIPPLKFSHGGDQF